MIHQHRYIFVIKRSATDDFLMSQNLLKSVFVKKNREENDPPQAKKTHSMFQKTNFASKIDLLVSKNHKISACGGPKFN